MSRSLFTSAICAVLATACGSSSPSEDVVDAAPADASPICAEATQHDDLAWLEDNILTPSCAGFAACHMGAAQEAGGLNLEAGNSHDALVGIDSGLFADWKLVTAGDANASYLMVILGQIDGPIDPDVGTMPGGNNPLICREKRDALERWINAGAPN